MVVGNGMIANRFLGYKTNSRFLIFASGVSDSQEKNIDAFERERNLILASIDAHPETTFVYFSTCSIYDPDVADSPYVQHKINMECLIQKKANYYYIFRVSQIVGRTKNNTLINFIFNKIKEQDFFEVWENCTRNLIDIDDVYQIVHYILKNNILINQVINLANKISIPIKEIVSIVEDCVGLKGRYKCLNKGVAYTSLDISLIENILHEMNIYFNFSYYQDVIYKYYNLR